MAALSRLRRFVWGLATSFSYERFDLRQRNQIIFMNLVSYTGVVVMFVYSAIAFHAGNAPLAWATLLAGVATSVILAGTIVFKRFVLAGWLITFGMATLFGFLAYTGGENGSGILWIQAFPLIAMFLIDVRWGSAITAAFLGFVAVCLFVPQFNHAGFTTAYSIRVLGTFAYVWVFGLAYGVIRGRTEGALAETNQRLSQTTHALSFEKKQTDGILRNVREGIFLVDRELKIGSSYSSHLGDIFETADLAGRALPELLKPMLGERDYQAAADWLPMLFGDAVNPSLLAEINPLAEVQADFFNDSGLSHQKFLRFGFTRVQLDEGEPLMLGVVRDATDEVLLQRQIEAESRKHQQAMEKLFQIIHVDPAMMGEFIADTEAELDSVNALLRDQSVPPAEIMPHMFQSVHSIKGNALLLGLNELGRKVHEVEEQVKPFLDRDVSWKELLGLTISLGMIQQELAEIRGLIDKVVAFQSASTEAGLDERGLLERTISRMVGIESQRSGKPVAVVFDEFDSSRIPEERRKLVKDVLVQLIRNAIAHGVEAPAERQAAGKPAQGTITLGLKNEGGTLLAFCRDDGRGLDLEAIRNKASSLPDVDQAALAAMKPADVAQLIFRNGFSTAAAADLGSGRGAGMALVKNRVEAAGGKIGLKSRAGQLCEVSFRLPL